MTLGLRYPVLIKKLFLNLNYLNRFVQLFKQGMNSEFSNNKQIIKVNSFDQLIQTAFEGERNAICWHRNLAGDFKEVVEQLELKENITDVSMEELLALKLSAQGAVAREILFNDLKLLTDFGSSPSLNLIKNYHRDDELAFISTDVYSFHVDRSPIATDTFLCTYYGAASEILPNDQVEQKILIPEIRQKLSDLHDGSEGSFEDFLETYFFDLHYQPKPNANPINLGNGHLWKLAVDHPNQHVLPCVHRAPVETKGEYRLLLIC